MHFSKFAFSLVASSAICNASPVPQEGAINANIPPSHSSAFSGTRTDDGKLAIGQALGSQDNQTLQKKELVTAVVTIIAEQVVAKLTETAINFAAEQIKNLGEWNQVRETFTQATTLEMWNRNPDYKKYPAAICYNKGYRLLNPAGIAELASAKLELGVLNTDYDCMYMEAGNQFYTDSDGGFINLSYRYDDRCTFDQETGDLTCK